jgi:serine phosphatase RsbU (regulator of sigma subunit)
MYWNMPQLITVFILLENGELISCPADKMPVGKHSDMKPFTLRKMDLQKGDIVYSLTDGYADQFWRTKRKKIQIQAIRRIIG